MNIQRPKSLIFNSCACKILLYLSENLALSLSLSRWPLQQLFTLLLRRILNLLCPTSPMRLHKGLQSCFKRTTTRMILSSQTKVFTVSDSINSTWNTNDYRFIEDCDGVLLRYEYRNVLTRHAQGAELFIANVHNSTGTVRHHGGSECGATATR